MYVSDIVEEINEKLDNWLSVPSLLRKITSVRDRLLRDYGFGQQRETVCTGFDIEAGKEEYLPPCPPSNVVDVAIFRPHTGKWERIPHRQFNRDVNSTYYYFLGGIFGLWPVPSENIPMGVKIFHIPTLGPLTEADMDKTTGFDPDYDMLIVFGVLREIAKGRDAAEYDLRYQQLLLDYQRVSAGFDNQITLESW